MRILDRLGFEQSLYSPWFFRCFVRRALYRRLRDESGRTDPERVHEEALRMLNEYDDILYENRGAFSFPELVVSIKGRDIQPFGTAAGLDKNGDALKPLSRVFGFQETGTIVFNERRGNDRPRLAVDEEREEIYNAQGFPSMGLQYFLKKIRAYRAQGGRAVVYASVCGLPSSPDKLGAALDEMEIILRELEPYVDGFVWNPFSPNTEALTALRRPEVFRDHAELIREKAGHKLVLVKMGPYEEEGKRSWLELAEAFQDDGGDGIVAVNTYMVPKESVPSKDWGYKSAGRSGRFLAPYRRAAVRESRQAFPGSIIFATGGITHPADAYDTLLAGADALEGYTPYTYHGLGLARRLMQGVSDRLREDRYINLQELRDLRRLSRF